MAVTTAAQRAISLNKVCLECYRWLPHPLLSFLVSYFRHFSSLDSVSRFLL